MKSKTMIAIAAASTFGWAAAAHAGTGHQASWVAAGDEQYPPMMMFDGQSTPTTAGLLPPDTLAANEGVYSDYYVVTWTPASGSGWATYAIAPAAESEVLLSLNDDDVIASTYDVILLPADVLTSESNADLFYER